LHQSLKKKIPMQILVYLACFTLLAIFIYNSIKGEIDFNKMERSKKHEVFEDLNKGDTAILRGWITFRRYETKAIQDTMERLDHEQDSIRSESWFQIEIPAHDKKEWHLKTIIIDLKAHDSLLKYMNYELQLKNALTYILTFKAIKKSQTDESWRLLQLIKIDSINALPHYWQ